MTDPLFCSLLSSDPRLRKLRDCLHQDAPLGWQGVLLSSIVRVLVVGSGIKFSSESTHLMKGVPGKSLLCRVLAN